MQEKPVDAEVITQKSIEEKLLEVQQELIVPKGRVNQYGKYPYRSKEDIIESAKPILAKKRLLLKVDDSLHTEEGWHYIKARAEVFDIDTHQGAVAFAYAREPISKKGMDESQITGTAASYAEKRALCNLFAIDDGTQDADALNDGTHDSTGFVAECKNCHTAYQFSSKEEFEAWKPTAQCCATPDWAERKC